MAPSDKPLNSCCVSWGISSDIKPEIQQSRPGETTPGPTGKKRKCSSPVGLEQRHADYSFSCSSSPALSHLKTANSNSFRSPLASYSTLPIAVLKVLVCM